MVDDKLLFRWFLGMSIDGASFDHSTISGFVGGPRRRAIKPAVAMIKDRRLRGLDGRTLGSAA